MCFSANASFTASAALSVVGILTIKKANTTSQIVFACIPLLFAVQQLTEGFVWLSFANENFETWRPLCSKLFLFLAQAAWPFCIPLSIYLIEKEAKRKRILLIPTFVGLIAALYFTYCLFMYSIKADVMLHHIHYTQNFPKAFNWVSSAFYYISTVLPAFISSNKRIKLIGITIIVTYIVTRIFYLKFLISVWCFFASIISLLVLFILDELNKPLISINKNYSLS